MINNLKNKKKNNNIKIEIWCVQKYFLYIIYMSSDSTYQIDQESIIELPVVQLTPEEHVVQEPIVQEPVVQEPIVQEPVVQLTPDEQKKQMILDKIERLKIDNKPTSSRFIKHLTDKLERMEKSLKQKTSRMALEQNENSLKKIKHVQEDIGNLNDVENVKENRIKCRKQHILLNNNNKILNQRSIIPNMQFSSRTLSRSLSGSGTELDPILIGSANDWEDILDMLLVDETYIDGKYLKLTADITLDGDQLTGYNNNYVAIVGSNYIFDGDNHTITIQNMPYTEINFHGLFESYNDIEIKNLNVVIGANVEMYEGGAICYRISNYCIMINCHVSGNIIAVPNFNGETGEYYIINLGTLVGYIDYDCELTNCSSSANITSSISEMIDDIEKIGGLIGQVDEDVDVMIDCYYTGNITLNNSKDIGYIGGLIGQVDDDTYDIQNCYYQGNINIESSHIRYIGGLIGYIDDELKVDIINCHSSGQIICNQIGDNSGSDDIHQIGGLIGYLSDGNGKHMDRCYSEMTITITGDNIDYIEYVGGLLGQASGVYIINSWYDGDITITMENSKEDRRIEDIGGLVGYFSGSSGYVENSYSDGSMTITCDFNVIKVGGICGYSNYYIGKCRSCIDLTINSGNIAGIGGLCGLLESDIYESFYTGSINLTGELQVYDIGCIAGRMDYSNCNDTYADANIDIQTNGLGTGNLWSIGGLFGYIENGSIQTSYVTGNVTCTDNVGTFNNNENINKCVGGFNLSGIFANVYYDAVNYIFDTDPENDDGSEPITFNSSLTLADMNFSADYWVDPIPRYGSTNFYYPKLRNFLPETNVEDEELYPWINYDEFNSCPILKLEVIVINKEGLNKVLINSLNNGDSIITDGEIILFNGRFIKINNQYKTSSYINLIRDIHRNEIYKFKL